ncbi:MAG: DUF2617 family protein [Gemmataceae bacterium]|nr:DUF2617 family protein [Gemmataceae bacterium]
MNMHLVRPPVADLVFQVYAKPLHPELFEILATRTWQRDDWRVSVHITRSGHVVAWHSRGVFLTEIADAAQSGIITETRRLLHYRLRGEHCASLRCGDVVYQTSFQVETLPPEIFRHVHNEILADGDKRGFLHHFQPSHRWAPAPLGHVILEARARCLFVTSFHTYPEDRAVVKAQTLIERAS